MYVLLAAAILCEVTGTLAPKFSEGMSKLVPTVAVLVCYGVAFLLFSLSLNQGMAVGTAYAIWSGAGVGLVVLGLTAIQLGGAHT
ncbi:multidrug efflux SMR transporter [Allokutzneria sp. NRRL B-24872]|uniref:DMT family transporter n=1 Tax=Allokutzneria sp. NRRL B-24872 TaxID=1137961 RepID=UPI000A375BB4|nr:SMR family transporter [Allokutzneria sp. NRRL B-24872]